MREREEEQGRKTVFCCCFPESSDFCRKPSEVETSSVMQKHMRQLLGMQQHVFLSFPLCPTKADIRVNQIWVLHPDEQACENAEKMLWLTKGKSPCAFDQHSFYRIISTWRSNTDWFNCHVGYLTPSECLYSNLKMTWFARSLPRRPFAPHNSRKIIGYKYSKEAINVSSGECQTTFRIWRSRVPSFPSPTWGDQLPPNPFWQIGQPKCKADIFDRRGARCLGHKKQEDLHVMNSGEMF